MRTKWATHEFTEREEVARRRWRRAEKMENEIREGLKVSVSGNSRKEYHAILDRRLDQIEKRKREAREDFPEVEESFTVATMSLWI